ncbi:hypothetical protein HK104_009158 [Borealophlyctis nickersoniae]|nr:hypothetical protein HK104_009158 [Borealophlyctis nickersoniae]
MPFFLFKKKREVLPPPTPTPRPKPVVASPPPPPPKVLLADEIRHGMAKQKEEKLREDGAAAQREDGAAAPRLETALMSEEAELSVGGDKGNSTTGGIMTAAQAFVRIVRFLLLICFNVGVPFGVGGANSGGNIRGSAQTKEVIRKVVERDEKGQFYSPDGYLDDDYIEHFLLVAEAIDKVCPQGLRVTKVEYIVNPTLAAIYETQKEAFRKANKVITERILFHGTPEQNVESILRDGFRTSHNIRIYCAPDPKTAMPYSRGHKAFIALKALPGVHPVDYEDWRWCIVFRTAQQTLPCYVVHYTDG